MDRSSARLSRRSALRSVLLGGGAALLAACQQPAAQPAAAPTARPTEAPKPAAAQPPTAPAAAPKPTEAPRPAASAAPAAGQPAARASEIVIGAIHPLSGALAQDGTFLKNGIDLAVEEVNNAGGIKALGGATLRVSHADSQGKPEVGQSEATRLIGENVAALIGTYQSAVTLNATQVAEQAKVPFVIDVTVANAILERGFKYTFRIQPDQTQMVQGLIEALPELKLANGQPIKRIAYMHEDSVFGTGFVDIFKQLAGTANLELVGTVPYSVSGLTDVTTELTRMQAMNADVALVTGYLSDGILIARTARDIQLRAPLIGLANGAFSTDVFVQQLGPLAEGIMDANYHYDATKPRARDVRDRYRAKFNADMPTHGVMAYEAVRVLADALERAGSPDRQKVRDALAATTYADHILPYEGPIQFDEKGQARNARSILMQVQSSRIVQVAPAKFAEARPNFPPSR